jgi:hypothetical protein
MRIVIRGLGWGISLTKPEVTRADVLRLAQRVGVPIVLDEDSAGIPTMLKFPNKRIGEVQIFR